MPRLFVALPVPENVADILLDTMEALPGARWQDADNLHITLRFIGEVDVRQADDIALALSSVRFEPIDLALAGVGHFERKGRATSIWARVEPSDALAALQTRVEMACRRAGLADETRKFIPHVTIARLNMSSGDAAPWLARHEGLEAGPWLAGGFALYDSHLGEHGAQYQALLAFPLAQQ